MSSHSWFSPPKELLGECVVFLKTLASEICSKPKDLRYPAVMGAIRAKLEFVILRWNITCLRGSRAFLFAQAKLFTRMPSAMTSQKILSISLFFLSFSLSESLFLSPPPSPLSLSLSLSLSPLPQALCWSNNVPMYQFLRYEDDLCWLFSLSFFWLA